MISLFATKLRTWFNPTVLMLKCHRSLVVASRNCSTAVTSKSAGSTAQAKDIIIYKHENHRFMKWMSVFTISQLSFWGYLSVVTYNLEDVPAPEDKNNELPFYRKINFGDDVTKKVLAGIYATIGYLIFTGGWFYIARSIRYLILRKDGLTVALVTYHPTGRNGIMNVPINCISASGSRTSGKSYIPLKVKDKSMFYLVDNSKGTFTRPELFDRTVGIQRKFK